LYKGPAVANEPVSQKGIISCGLGLLEYSIGFASLTTRQVIY
jgi:hypothetical protein